MAIQLVTLPPVTVVSAGTAVVVYTPRLAVTSVTIQAAFGNTGNIYLGDASVTTVNGQSIPPGDVAVIQGDNAPTGRTEEFFLDEVYLNADTSGNSARIIGFKRKP